MFALSALCMRSLSQMCVLHIHVCVRPIPCLLADLAIGVLVSGDARVVCKRAAPVSSAPLVIGLLGPGQWYGEKPVLTGKLGAFSACYWLFVCLFVYLFV